MLKKHRPKILLQIKVFADNKKVFEHLFQKVPRSRACRHCRAPRSAKAPIGVFFFCSFFFCACFAKRKSGWRICFFFCLLTILGFCMVGELTHMRSMCVGVAETGVEHCSPAKNHKVTFRLSYFCVTKSTKSQQGGLTPSSFRTSCGVHEFVARAVRGEYVRQRIK